MKMAMKYIQDSAFHLQNSSWCCCYKYFSEVIWRSKLSWIILLKRIIWKSQPFLIDVDPHLCCCLVTKSCWLFCYSMDYGPPGSSVRGLPRWHSSKASCLPMQGAQEMWVWSLDGEDPLEEKMATHASILAWKIPWTEEPGGLQSMGCQRVRHDWHTSQSAGQRLLHIYNFLFSIHHLSMHFRVDVFNSYKKFHPNFNI